MHCNPLNRLILPGWLQDLQQQLVHPAVLKLQLFRNAEVAKSQAAVALDLQWENKGTNKTFKVHKPNETIEIMKHVYSQVGFKN